MSVKETIVIAILILWFIASLLYSILNNQLARYTQRLDLFRFVSAYYLFSGTPRNYKLFYRDRHLNKTESEWHQIVLTPNYKWYHPAWYPGSAVNTVICSAIDDLISIEKRSRDMGNISNIAERFIYRAIVRYVNRFPPVPNLEARQFKIEEINGFTETQQTVYIYVSDFHSL